MNMLQLAIAARVPFIAVKTDDTVYAEDVLAFIADEDIALLPTDMPEDLTSWALPKANVLYTVHPVESKELYFLLQSEQKTLVFLNPAKPSVMHFNGGQLLPPRSQTKATLLDLFGKEEIAEELLPTLGGLTLKDVREILMLSMQEFGEVTAKTVNSIRQGYITKLKGMVQIEAAMSYYECPESLKKWIAQNEYFFKNDDVPSLRPRGLLFDGPPGTGKTSAAKEIANQFGVPLFRLDIGGMKGKYVGDSEGNLNSALASIDAMAPCVVILDEIEKMFGEHHDQGTTSSMLGGLLWWLQEHESKVFTVMTTNDKSIIPKELYRPGRIDMVMKFLGVEGKSQAIEFSKQLIKSFGDLPLNNTDSLHKEIAEVLATKSYPLPQVEIVAITNEKIKAHLLESMK